MTLSSPAFTSPSVQTFRQSSKISLCTNFRNRPLLCSKRRFTIHLATTMAAELSAQNDPSPFFAGLFPNERAMVLANDGTEVNLVDVVAAKNGVVVIGWLRHYGCTLCKKQAADWISLREKLDASNVFPVSMILVGNGKPTQATDFAKEMEWKEDLFSDPSRATYAALGFSKGLKSLLTLPSLRNTIRSFQEGHSQTLFRIPTDPLQQGGALVVNEGRVTLFHRDPAAGMHASLDDLLNAIHSAAMPGKARTEEPIGT